MQSIIVSTIYLLSILIPLTFTTLNFELFEFPKFILLLSGTLIITTAWIIHIFQNRNSKLFPSHFSLISASILAIFITQTISTLFSINPYTSFWGYYSRYHGGLLTTICYTIIYFAAIKWLDSKSTLKLIKISVGTAFVVSLYGILEHFGIDKSLWVQDVQSRVFSTLGQPNWLAAYLIPNLFLTIYLSQINKNKKEVIPHIIFTTLFVALLFTKSRSGLIAFALSFITYYLILLRQFSFPHLKKSFFLFTFTLSLFTLIIGTPFTPIISSVFNKSLTGVLENRNTGLPTGTTLETGGTESGDIRKIVWSGALELVKRYPLIGTGPETFAYTYYWVRPLAHNMTSEWDFLYNKAHNEYLNIAAGSGVIGLLAYLYFHFTVFGVSLTTIAKNKKIVQDKKDELRYLYPVLGASIVAFAITNFFGFSVIPVYFLMIIIAALGTAPVGVDPRVDPHNFLFVYLLIFLVLIYPIRLFAADVNYAKGKRLFDAGQYSLSIPLLTKAVTTRPYLDLYHSTLGEAYAGLGQKNLALRELELNKKLNPYHLNFFKSRAKIYLTLASVDTSYHNQAAAELESARKLAPTDPKLAYNLGLVYTRLDKVELSAKNLEDAITLKPNYAEPYYALTLLYEQTKQIDKITPLLTSAKSNLATYSAQLKEKIEKYTN